MSSRQSARRRSRDRRRALEEVWMVGRLRAALPVLALLGAASPLTSQPSPVLLDLPTGIAVESLSDGADELGSADGSPAPPAAAAPAPAPAAFHDPTPDSGEFGIEYQLSLRDADSFLGRLTTRLKRLVEQAMTYLGTPYRMGGTSRRGLDCSGLVGAVYGEQGLGMPRTAAEQFAEGVPVSAGELRPGDLVFFRDTYKRGISHVGIFVGDGHFIHAAGRRQGVIVSELSRPYYRLRYAGARRLAPRAETTGSDRMANASRPDEPGPAASLPLPSSGRAPSQ
jgi:cell wall-associated NlpC family hydrolase